MLPALYQGHMQKQSKKKKINNENCDEMRWCLQR